MTVAEFSNEFNILYNNISSNAAPGLDEYEKSVFLTKAQLEILKNYFNPQGNKYGLGFDDNPKRQIDFSNIIKVAKPLEAESPENYIKFDDRSKVYTMPSDVLLIINETAIETILDTKRLISIIPITFLEYTRLMSKPYKLPLKNLGWRLFQSISSGLGFSYVSEVIIKKGSTITDYKIRYVQRPRPIVLVDISGDDYDKLSIDGVSKVSECQLDSAIHSEILLRAVELAKAVYVSDLKSTVELGQRTE